MSKELNLHQKLCVIQTELNAPKNLYNSFGNYKYRDAEGILDALKPFLKEHCLTIKLFDEIVLVGERFYVKATAQLTDIEGKEEESCAYAREEYEKKGMDSAQITGSVSSYARKYALNGLLAINDVKDPDNSKNIKEKSKKQDVKDPDNSNQGIHFCSCGKQISEKVANWSEKNLGKKLCVDCQKKDKKPDDSDIYLGIIEQNSVDELENYWRENKNKVNNPEDLKKSCAARKAMIL